MGVDINVDDTYRYFPFLESQEIPYVKHNCSITPYPFEDNSYDVVTCIGSISNYQASWLVVLSEFFRIAKECVYLVVNSGHLLEENHNALVNLTYQKWYPTSPCRGTYKWRCKDASLA